MQLSHSQKSFLWSLPQPVYVLGFTFLTASACLYQWVDPWYMFSLVLWLSYGALLLAERLFPRREEWHLNTRDLARDTFWILGAQFLWSPFFREYYDVHIRTLFESIRESMGFTYSLDASTFGGLIFMAFIVILVMEFITYWVHRLQHKFLFLWRMHATHHFVSKMSVGRTDRGHPLEFLALNLGIVIAFSFLDASADVVAVVVMFRFTTVHMNHANLPLTAGIFGWVFTTAESHQLHHSLDYAESNQNYGCAVILWDRVFGTFSNKKSVEKIGSGTGQPLPLHQQLLLPFYSNRRLKAL